MRKSIIAITTSAALLLGGIGIANADKLGEHKGKGGPNVERIAQALELTEEQIIKLDTAMSSSGVEMRQVGRASFAVGKQLRELDPSAPDYQVQVDELKAIASANAAHMVQMRADQQKAMVEILTPEQLAKLEELKEKRQARMEQHKSGKHDKKQMDEYKS